jgi:nicotinic acid phosphoribosyltransferase
MVAYGEFRSPFQHDERDHRFVFYGIRYIIEHYVQRRWTEQDVSAAAAFFATHNLQHSAFPFPHDLFLRFIREHNGYFPVRIDALPEGTVAHVHTPVFQLFARHEYSRLVTFLETLLTMVWYGSSVATLSRRTKDVIAAAFEQSVDDDHRYLLDSRLHDFGFRGCTTVEQSVVGGCAHLLNFTGSDTMSAGYYAQMSPHSRTPAQRCSQPALPSV